MHFHNKNKILYQTYYVMTV